MFMVLPSLQINFKKFAATDSDMRLGRRIKHDTVEKRRNIRYVLDQVRHAIFVKLNVIFRCELSSYVVDEKLLREETLAMVWLITGAGLPTPYAERLALPQVMFLSVL
ncbi:hypothetical protein Tco_0729678 [Tanacetum coccineum]|uniref:Uncharacterized protein n=1 Tax=Tanacetum coccineum TaxID=301880 RepID=A0ABQ4YSB8_9ASTR